jgi:hypothetical protein
MPLQGQSSPLLINEVGVMPFSGQRYIELLVVGYAEQPNETADLRGWAVSKGLPGHGSDGGTIVFGACFAALPPGTLVLIYDDANRHPGISTTEDGFPNAQGRYQLPLSSGCLEKRIGSYGDDSPAPPGAAWAEVLPLKQGGEALHIRDSQGKFRFALSWHRENVLPDHPKIAKLDIRNNPGANSIALRGKICAEDRDAYYEARFVGTPGQKNSAENEAFIMELAEGGSARQPLSIQCFEQEPDRGSGGSIEIIVEGGAPPYTIQWQGPDGTSGSTVMYAPGVFEAQGLGDGVYQIEVEDGRGCTAKCWTFIAVLEEILICEGECLTIGESDTGSGHCYYWMPEGYFDDPTAPTQEVCPEQAEHFSLMITNEEGEIVGERAFTVEAAPGQLKLLPDPAMICPNASVELSVVGTYSSYQWSTGANTPSIAVSQPGVYSVTATSTQTSAVSGQACTAEGEIEVFSSGDEAAAMAWFEENGFQRYDIEVLGPILGPVPSNINDYASLLILLEGEEINIAQKIAEYYNLLSSQNEVCSTTPDYSVYITSDLCAAPSTAAVNAMFASDEAAFRFWFHIFQGEANSYLYVKAYSYFTEGFLQDEEAELAAYSDYPTWGAVQYLMGGPVASVNYTQNDYFSTQGVYLGSGNSGGLIKIVNMEGANLAGMSQAQKIAYFENNTVAALNEHAFYLPNGDAYNKIAAYYYNHYLCTNLKIGFVRQGGGFSSGAYNKTGKTCSKLNPNPKKKPRLSDAGMTFYSVLSCRKVIFLGFNFISATPFSGANCLGDETSAEITLNYKSNFVSILSHEDHHYTYDFVEKEMDIGWGVKPYIVHYDSSLEGSDESRRRHLIGAYYAQVNDPSFNHLTNSFKLDIKCNIDEFIDQMVSPAIKNEMRQLFNSYF